MWSIKYASKVSFITAALCWFCATFLLLCRWLEARWQNLEDFVLLSLKWGKEVLQTLLDTSDQVLKSPERSPFNKWAWFHSALSLSNVLPVTLCNPCGDFAGDQVLEWNGRLLQGATFKEVYNIILESKPEPQVELVVSRPIGWVLHNCPQHDCARGVTRGGSESAMDPAKILVVPTWPDSFNFLILNFLLGVYLLFPLAIKDPLTL